MDYLSPAPELTKAVEQAGCGLVVLTGLNGGGKSRWLGRLLRTAVSGDRHVIAVANTPYDKFGSLPKTVARSLIRSGRSAPRKALASILSAMSDLSDRSLVRLRRIPRVLEHCNYDPVVGVRIRGFDRAQAYKEWESEFALATDFVVGAAAEVVWIDFESSNPMQLGREILPRMLQAEPALRRAGVLKRIELFLRRERTNSIPLDSASSGELSLISTLLVVAMQVEDGSLILIDEPENSLHPHWQRQYLTLLFDVIGYTRASVVVATHAPLIVSTAFGESERGVLVFRVQNGEASRQDGKPISIEAVLAETLDTVTPHNHYLSRRLTALLSQVEIDNNCVAAVKGHMRRYWKASTDKRQRATLEAAMRLAERIAENDGELD